MNDGYQDRFFDLLNVLSFVVGVQNLEENRVQSAQNDVQSANDKQAEYLLREINTRFDEQNKILRDQNEMLKRLLDASTEK